MVMSGRSVYLTTLFFLAKLEQAVNQYFVHILSLLTDKFREGVQVHSLAYLFLFHKYIANSFNKLYSKY